jgi:uncharacterized RDD family membrane protein YckC
MASTAKTRRVKTGRDGDGLFRTPPSSSPVSRALARTVDVLLAVALFLVLRWIGTFVGALVASAYVLFQDGLGSGQSFGKRLFELRVVDETTRLPCTLEQSMRRNAVGALTALLLGFEVTRPLGVLVALAAAGVEAYLFLVSGSGVRWGDVYSGTRVVETLQPEPDASRSSPHDPG